MSPRALQAEPAVFFISAAILAFEILLLRLFAIEHLHHFANVAIGMAMLGFGASGTALMLARRHIHGREQRWLEVAAVLFTLSLVFVIPVAHLVDYDPTQLLWDLRQWRGLALVYGILAAPFALGAAAIALALMQARDRVGRVYAANLIGSAAGSLLAIGLLALFRPERAVAATSILAALGAVMMLVGDRTTPRLGSRPLRTGLAYTLIALTVATTVRPPWTPRISPFKGQPQVAAFAGARFVGERWGPVGWTIALHAPAFRHAPGLSLVFPGTLPPQTALFVDGATVGAATDWRGDTTALAFLRWLPSAAAFVTPPFGRVLVLGSGDGLEALAAIVHGAHEITAVELNASLVELADAVVPAPSRVYSDPRVRVVTGDVRTFVARTAQRFDLIVLPISGAMTGTTGALHGVGEDYLNTVEAYTAYLRLLVPDGTLTLIRWADTPPRDNIRVLLTGAAALRRLGVAHVGESIVLLRSWAAISLLLRPAGFKEPELDALVAFAQDRMFELDWPEQLATGTDSLLTFAARAAAHGQREAEAFAHDYPFHVSPATDDRPYSGRFLRLTSLPALLRAPLGDWLPFAEWGYLALVVTLLQSAAIAALLTVVPAALLSTAARRGVRRTGHADEDGLTLRRALRTGVYFGAIGAAYLFIEIAMIQKLTLLLGHPIYAAAAVLALFLAFSGAGSSWSDRLSPERARPAAASAAAAALVIAMALGAVAHIQPTPFPIRLLTALLLLAPLAFCMGFPFPLGLRASAPTHATRAWAWAVNGFASVIAASLAALIAIEVGIRSHLLFGASLYLVAATAAVPHARRHTAA